MTQTVGAKSMRSVDVHYSSTSGWVWNEISGTVNAIEVSGGDRISGEAWTADSDQPIVLFGKMNPLEVTGKIIYSEVTAEAFIDLEALYKNGTNIRMSWAPGGWSTGNLLFKTDTVQITNFGYPSGEVQDGNPIMVGFTVRAGTITYARMTSGSGTF